MLILWHSVKLIVSTGWVENCKKSTYLVANISQQAGVRGGEKCELRCKAVAAGDRSQQQQRASSSAREVRCWVWNCCGWRLILVMLAVKFGESFDEV